MQVREGNRQCGQPAVYKPVPAQVPFSDRFQFADEDLPYRVPLQGHDNLYHEPGAAGEFQGGTASGKRRDRPSLHEDGMQSPLRGKWEQGAGVIQLHNVGDACRRR